MENDFRAFREGIRKLVKEYQESDLSKISESSARFSKKVSAMEKRLASIERSILESPQSKPLAKLSLLEKKIAGLEILFKSDGSIQSRSSRSSNVRIKILSFQIKSLERKFLAVKKSQRSISSQLLPTKKLAESEPSVEKNRHAALLREMESRRLSGEKEANKRISDLEESVQRSISSFEKKLSALDESLSHRLAKKEEELVKIAASGDLHLNKKLNTQFLSWLSSLEEEIKKRVSQNIASLENLGKELHHAKKEFVRRKDLHDFEEHVISPLGDIDKRMKAFIQAEISRLESEIKRSGISGSIDRQVLQKEIDKVVKDLEARRTQSLEEEISKLVKEGEKMKNRRL